MCIKYHVMNSSGLEVKPHLYLTSAQDGAELPVLRPSHIVEKEPPKPFVQEAGWALDMRSGGLDSEAMRK
jgi:hypothetical protein